MLLCGGVSVLWVTDAVWWCICAVVGRCLLCGGVSVLWVTNTCCVVVDLGCGVFSLPASPVYDNTLSLGRNSIF